MVENLYKMLTAVIGNLYMEEFEEQALATVPHNPKF